MEEDAEVLEALEDWAVYAWENPDVVFGVEGDMPELAPKVEGVSPVLAVADADDVERQQRRHRAWAEEFLHRPFPPKCGRAIYANWSLPPPRFPYPPGYCWFDDMCNAMDAADYFLPTPAWPWWILKIWEQPAPTRVDRFRMVTFFAVNGMSPDLIQGTMFTRWYDLYTAKEDRMDKLRDSIDRVLSLANAHKYYGWSWLVGHDEPCAVCERSPLDLAELTSGKV